MNREQIQTLIELYSSYVNVCPSWQEILEQKTQQEKLIILNQKLKEQHDLCQSVVKKSLSLLHHIKDEEIYQKYKILQLQQALDQKNTNIQNYQYKITKLEVRLSQLLREYERQKNEINLLEQNSDLKQNNIDLHISERLAEMSQQNVRLKEQRVELTKKYEQIVGKYDESTLILSEMECFYSKMKNDFQNQILVIKDLQNIISQGLCKQSQLEEAIYERDNYINELRQFIHKQNINCHYPEELQNYESAFNDQQQIQNFNQERQTQNKLLKLSEEINLRQGQFKLQFLTTSRDNSVVDQSEHGLVKCDSKEIKFEEFKRHRKDSEKIVVDLRKVSSEKSFLKYFWLKEKQSEKQLIDRQDKNQVGMDEYNIIDEKQQQKEVVVKKQLSKAFETLHTENESSLSVIKQQPKLQMVRQDMMFVKSIDPYLIHYELTCQSIKIEEDEDGIYGILELDMKPYYQFLKTSDIPFPKWPQWIRQKLLALHQQNNHMYQQSK